MRKSAIVSELIVVSVLLGGLLVIVNDAMAQAVDRERLNSNIAISIVNKSPACAFAGLAFASGISIGAEITLESQNEHQPALSLARQGETFARVMDELVAQMPGYAWKFEDGVVVVRPIRDQRSILDDTIRSVSLRNVLFEELPNSILNSGDFVRLLNNSGWKKRANIPCQSKIGENSLIKTQNIHKSILTKEFADVTFRDILNDLLKSGDADFWMLDSSRTTTKEIMLIIER